jgi:hypothetical protein
MYFVRCRLLFLSVVVLPVCFAGCIVYCICFFASCFVLPVAVFLPVALFFCRLLCFRFVSVALFAGCSVLSLLYLSVLFCRLLILLVVDLFSWSVALFSRSVASLAWVGARASGR